jgi:glycolate oxidase
VYRTDDPEEGEAFAAARRAVLPAFEQSGAALLLEDVSIQVSDLPNLIRGIQDIASESATTVAIVAHAGDGNLHPLIVYDSDDEGATRRAHETFDAVMRHVIASGGTIAGEHGVGRLKKAWLPDYLGADVLKLNHAIKNALDPNGILNPGCMFD